MLVALPAFDVSSSQFSGTPCSRGCALPENHLKTLTLELLKTAALSTAISLCFAPSADAADATTLGTVNVTANRSAVPVAQTLASVTVLTRADIEKSQAPDLVDLLTRQVGIDMTRTGGPGSQNSVFLRGTNSNHALVLIDGIRVNSATQGLFDFAHLPLSQIDRIEIVRGPRAALWGSDAIGGVIQIFTRDPAAAYADTYVGSYGRAGIDGGFGGGDGDTRFGIGVGFGRSRGFSATNPEAGPYSYDPDDDGYRNRNLSLRAQTMLGSQRLAFTGLVTDADVEFDAGPWASNAETSALNREFGVVLAGDLSSRWAHSLTLGHNSEVLNTPVYWSRFGSARTSLDWINTLTLDANNTLNVGVNWSRETGESNGSFSDRSRRNAAAFAAWRGRFDAQTFELSLRRDDNSQFHGATTGNAAWGWQINDAFRMRASWGQGFRAPNFNELYYPGFPIGLGTDPDGGPFFYLFAGNPDLQPERSISRELGLDWQISNHHQIGLSAYRTRINGLIAFQGPFSDAVNIGSASIDGVEMEYGYTRGGFALNGNATWQDPTNDDTGKSLLRRARRKLNLSADYRFDSGFSLGLDAQAFSARPDMDFNTFPAADINLSSYVRFDLRAAWQFASRWSLDARVENLGDTDYTLVQGYNTPGRSGMLTLRWAGN
jgi:vitamin B12 transporter